MTALEKLYQKGHTLSFPCTGCRQTVPLPLFQLENAEYCVYCPECLQGYCFADPQLRRQLHKFEALCRQIHASEEILSHTSIGVDVGPHQVKVPFKLLLTRLNANIELCVGSDKLMISFRLEPALLPAAALS